MFRFVAALLVVAVTGALSTPSASAQALRGEVEWLYWERDNDVDTGDVLAGPDRVDPSGIDFDNESGYRVKLTLGMPRYEIQAVYFDIDDFSGNQFGVLGQPLALDSEADNLIVFPTGANTLVLPNFLFDAAETLDTGVGVNELLEAEFLTAGAVFQQEYSSRLQNFELNLKQNRNTRVLRFGAGYRYVQVDESGRLLFRGIFDALDVDDAQTVGGVMNDPNDGLSNFALATSGATLLTGSANGFDNIASALGPDIIQQVIDEQTENQLHGGQFTVDWTVFERPLLAIDLFGTAGLFYNDASAQVTETVAGVVNDNSVYQRRLNDDDSTAAFVGSLGFRGWLYLTDYISVSAGYEAVFLAGLALGPDQAAGVDRDLTGTPFLDIQTDGSIIAHGGTLGLEVTW